MKYFIIILAFIFTIKSETINLFRAKPIELGYITKFSEVYDLKNGDKFSFKSSIQPPFKLEKLSPTKIKVTFDPKLKSGIVPENSFEASFVFEQKNIGRKKYLKFSAVYAPEYYFKENGKTKLILDFTPRRKAIGTDIVSSNESDSYLETDSNSTIQIEGIDNLLKGGNYVKFILIKDANFNDTLKFTKDGVKKLEITVRSQGFEKDLEEFLLDEEDSKKSSEITESSTDSSTVAGDVEKLPETTNETLPGEEITPKSEESSGSVFIYVVIILILLIIVAVLVIKTLIPKKHANEDKYETFFVKVAEVLEYNVTGKSLDGSMGEMIVNIVDLKSRSNDSSFEKSKVYESKSSIEDSFSVENDLILDDNLDDNLEDNDIEIDKIINKRLNEAVDIEIDDKELELIDEAVEKLIKGSKDKISD
ncbi:MAG: hypothetical protein CR982_05000 [Candidatus Cloacimonadota bacterium]|nr:MAG: hypothetical protein CR982_05000 [Candidatus Cloacimonadota bacterium]PIE78512.1 MAG: hypothetical protein CSA15_07405 [Candidatus Delongbacteria bacterium]